MVVKKKEVVITDKHRKIMRKYFKHIPGKYKTYRYYSTKETGLKFHEGAVIPKNDFIKIVNNHFVSEGLDKLPPSVILSNIRTYDKMIEDTRNKRIKREEDQRMQAEKKEEEERKRAKQERRANVKVVMKFTKNDVGIRRETKKYMKELVKTMKIYKDNRSNEISRFNFDQINHADYVVRSYGNETDRTLPGIKLYHHTEAPGYLRKATDKRVAPKEVPKRVRDDYEKLEKDVNKYNDLYTEYYDVNKLYEKYKDVKYTSEQKKKVSKSNRNLLKKHKIYFIESDNGFYFLG